MNRYHGNLFQTQWLQLVAGSCAYTITAKYLPFSVSVNQLVSVKMVPGPISGFAPSAVSSPSRSDVSSTILFDTSKSNQFGVNDGLRQIQRLLKNRWRLANTKDRLNIESLSASRLAILAGPQDRYNEAEFNALRQFIDLGGNLLVLLGEGGEQQFNTNINFLLEEYGIMINNGMPTKF